MDTVWENEIFPLTLSTITGCMSARKVRKIQLSGWHRSFVKSPRSWRGEDEPVNLFKKTSPYHYILRSGEVQTVDATYTVGESEHRLKYFQWLPIKKVYRCIDVKFSDELGEERGSWKGGVVGTGHKMIMTDKKYGIYERPEMTLHRMMRERYFGR